MALGTNPPFSTVRSFFGGPANLGAYTRGGGVVPNIPANNAISTTAAGLRLSQFSGADKQANATLSAAGGSMSASGAGNGSGGTVTASIALTPGGGNGSYAMSAAVIASNSVANPTASANTTRGFAGGGIGGANAPGSVASGTLTARFTNTSGGTSASVDVVTSLSWTNTTIPSCVLSISHVDPNSDKRAGDLTTEDNLLITDPYEEGLTILEGQVRISETHLQPCVRLEMANGTWLECSHSAPIPTIEGDYVNAIDLLHRMVPTATAEQLRKQDLGQMDWSRVMRVIDIGEREVQLLFVDDRAFWASGDGKRFVLHHNSKLII